MKELAAYLLLALAGKATPTSDEVKAVLNSVGIESSDEELSRLLAAVEGKVSVHTSLLFLQVLPLTSLRFFCM